MPINCDPSVLASNSTCYQCLTGDAAEAVKLYLLANIAGMGNVSPEDLAKRAACYTCIPKGMSDAVENYLMCQIVSSLNP